jgi:hypothetical protein
VTLRDQAVATDRLCRALIVFRTAQTLFLGAHRRLKALPQTEVEAFWDGPGGRRLEANMRAAAREVVAAFKAFSAVGLIAAADDRHLVTQAQRHLAEDAA